MRIAALSLAVVASLSSSAGCATNDPNLEERLRQIMAHCGRPHYLLKTTSHRQLFITAEPTVRQTPLTEADLKCIRTEVAKIGRWRLVEGRARR